MKTEMQLTGAVREVAKFICLIIFLLYVPSSKATTVEYEMNYNPVTKVTTLYNCPTSSEDLPFWTVLGPNDHQLLSLGAGDTITIDQSGNITGSYLARKPPCNNKKKGDDTIEIKNTGTKTISIQVDGQLIPCSPGETLTFSSLCRYWYPGGSSVEVKACDIMTLTEDTQFIGNSSSWPGLSDQTSIELLNGSLKSVDDTEHFQSLFTSAVVTGCIPEPSACVILGLGAYALWRRRDKNTSPKGELQ
jgi:hypothetical protein